MFGLIAAVSGSFAATGALVFKWRSARRPGVTEEQARAYCTYMSLQPTPQTIRQLQKENLRVLLSRAAKNLPSRSGPLTQDEHKWQELSRYVHLMSEFGYNNSQHDHAQANAGDDSPSFQPWPTQPPLTLLGDPRVRSILTVAAEHGWTAQFDPWAGYRCVLSCKPSQIQVALRWGTGDELLPLDYASAGSIDPSRSDSGTLTKTLALNDDGLSAGEHQTIIEQFLQVKDIA
jgi:hypothetical protein